MSDLLADRIIRLNKGLRYNQPLPQGYRVINPFRENPETETVMRRFYRKYYNDANARSFIIGINPGRLGAGVTGVPFTDTKRLESECGIVMESASTHEVSSVFMYDMIRAFGGPAAFYAQFYISSVFPLAIVRHKGNGRWLNANYYDEKALFEALEGYIIRSVKEQTDLGLETGEVFVLGKKNANFIRKLNKKAGLFGKLTVLEHPRYIQQYKSKQKEFYIDKYLKAFAGGR